MKGWVLLIGVVFTFIYCLRKIYLREEGSLLLTPVVLSLGYGLSYWIYQILI